MRGLTVVAGVRADGSRRGAVAKASLRGATASRRGAVDRGTIERDERVVGAEEEEGADETDGAGRGASIRGTEREAAGGADGAGADAWAPPLPPGERAPADRCCANATVDDVKIVIAKTGMAARIS
jgi:hypothetical protein